MANLLEYALGADPLAADAGGAMPRPTVVAGRLVLTFSRVADPALTYEVEATGDLEAAGWSVIWSSRGAANVSGSVSVTDVAEAPAQSRRFLRLRVH